MRVLQCSSHKDVIRWGTQVSLSSHSGKWTFRGQGDLSWTLLPSLLRREGRISVAQAFEKSMLEYARRTLRERTTLPARMFDNEANLMALLQHYGVPTRLLDWSKSLDVALYFAASSSLRMGTNFAVFALADLYAHVSHDAEGVMIPTTSPAGNQNMSAQRGTFTLHDWANADLWDNTKAKLARSIDELTSSAEVRNRLIKFEIESSEAGNSLNYLYDRGIDASTIFPGQHGICRLAEDLAYLDPFVAKKLLTNQKLYITQ